MEVFIGEKFPQNDVYKQIAWIGNLQKLKAENKEYMNYVTEDELRYENMLAMLYSEVLLESNFSKWLSFHLMKSLVDEELIDEGQVEDIIESNGYEHDYEWYTEDFIGCTPTAKTLVDIEQLLVCCKRKWDNILGIDEQNYDR